MKKPMSKKPCAPRAKKIPYKKKVHGRILHDDYHWLREKNNPDVRAYLKAENAYTAAVMKPAVRLQKRLYREMVARIKETDQSVPVKIDGFFYYSRTEKGKQYAIHCRKKGSLRSGEQIILDAISLRYS